MQKDLQNHTSKMKAAEALQAGGEALDNAGRTNELLASTCLSTPKSERGQWRRRKGPAPPRPAPQRRALRKLPLRQVQQELHDIEVKQTELERQGVLLETAIRERTELSPPNPQLSTTHLPPAPGEAVSSSDNAENSTTPSSLSDSEKLSGRVQLSGGAASDSEKLSGGAPYGMEVEDMILQLFELVNEKNELFRRQTELMYLKREKRLEEEYAELEFQIRCLMMKPSGERSEADARHEEELIARLVRVVEQRDEVVNCLDMERRREAVEDETIAAHLIKYHEKHIDGIESDDGREAAKKKKKKLRLIKKKKKKSKEKSCKVDADKDVDETEMIKKKKKKWFKKASNNLSIPSLLHHETDKK